jgi:phage-related minor tail protein
MSEHTTIIKLAFAAITILAGGILAANAAIKAYGIAVQAWAAIQKAATAVQWLFNAALSGNPIGIVIIALTALGVALVIAYQKSETFRNIVQGALNAVKVAVQALERAFESVRDAASAAFNWIAGHWKVGLFALGPIGVAIFLLIDHFNSLKAAGQDAFNAIAGVIGSVKGAIDAVIGAVESLIGALGRIHVPSIHLPHIPGFNMVAVPASASSKSPGSLATVGAGGTTINVYGQIDPEGTARTILRLLSDRERRQGR